MASPEPDETLDAVAPPPAPRLPIHEVDLPVYQPTPGPRPRAWGLLWFVIALLLSTVTALLIVRLLL